MKTHTHAVNVVCKIRIHMFYCVAQNLGFKPIILVHQCVQFCAQPKAVSTCVEYIVSIYGIRQTDNIYLLYKYNFPVYSLCFV